MYGPLLLAPTLVARSQPRASRPDVHHNGSPARRGSNPHAPLDPYPRPRPSLPRRRNRGLPPRMSSVSKHTAAAALIAVAVVVRVSAARGTLLYPDSYQYLLMARGIQEHLQPVLTLGKGGDLFVPNADAAAKPLYPAAIAVLHMLGFGWRASASGITAVAAGGAVALCGFLAARLTGSRLAGALAAAAFLLSPAARIWATYAVPDPVG